MNEKYTNTKNRGWSAARRARQRAAIHSWSPWSSSTGPRSEDGKHRASRNAYKHGKRSAKTLILRGLIANQKRLHASVAQHALRQNTTNELLDSPLLHMLTGAINDGVRLIGTLINPSVMQKPCILGPPGVKS